MLIHTSPLFSISFGDARNSIEPGECKSLTSTSLFMQEPFAGLQKRMSLSALVFLHQVHGTDGLVITQKKKIQDLTLFSEDGDFLVTNQRGIGLGVATADCVPIVFYDKTKQVIGIAHAGWRGSVAGIAQRVMSTLEEQFDTRKQDLEVYFGPSAKSCCYEVDQPFIDAVGTGNAVERALSKKGDRFFFDIGLFNAAQLILQGLSDQQLVFGYNTCTICHDTFCSYRRQKGTTARQVTTVSLK